MNPKQFLMQNTSFLVQLYTFPVTPIKSCPYFIKPQITIIPKDKNKDISFFLDQKSFNEPL